MVGRSERDPQQSEDRARSVQPAAKPPLIDTHLMLRRTTPHCRLEKSLFSSVARRLAYGDLVVLEISTL